MTTPADIIRQYAGACAAQAGQMSRESTVDDLRCIAAAMEHYGNTEIRPLDLFYLRNRLYLCVGGKSHWQHECGEGCR